MNKSELESVKTQLESERREIDRKLAPVLDELQKLKILSKVIDECDNGAGHYYKELWSDRMPSGDNEARLLCAMATEGLLRVKDYNGETINIKNHVGSTARFTITPLGRAALTESERETA